MLANIIVIILIVIATISFGAIALKLLWKAFFNNSINNKGRSSEPTTESQIIGVVNKLTTRLEESD